VLTLSFFQNSLSWLVPVRVFTTSSPMHPQLELFRYRGRWQLATEDAFYSDGAAYTPMLKAFAALGKQTLAFWNDVLVLGAGLGSAVEVLDRKYRLQPQLTLVDIDEAILELAGTLLGAAGHAHHVELICEDARLYVAQETALFDAVILDLFRGRQVPEFAQQPAFLNQCLQRLRSGGIFIMNYIINDDAQWVRLSGILGQVLPGYQVRSHGINRIVLWQKP
jgi:spermidine synthase